MDDSQSCAHFKSCPWGTGCSGQCQQVELGVEAHEGQVVVDFGGLHLGGLSLEPEAACTFANVLIEQAQAALRQTRLDPQAVLAEIQGGDLAH